MLLKIYESIKKLQAEIGNNAEVSFSMWGDMFEIRVDWWDKDFHARHQYTKIELEQLPEDYLISWCKNEYAKKVKK